MKANNNLIYFDQIKCIKNGQHNTCTTVSVLLGLICMLLAFLYAFYFCSKYLPSICKLSAEKFLKCFTCYFGILDLS